MKGVLLMALTLSVKIDRPLSHIEIVHCVC